MKYVTLFFINLKSAIMCSLTSEINILLSYYTILLYNTLNRYTWYYSNNYTSIYINIYIDILLGPHGSSMS